MKKLLATYQRLYQYVRPYKLRYIVALLITLPIGAVDGIIAWAIKPFMDQVLTQKAMHDLMWVPAVIIIFNVMQGLLRYYETYLNEYLAQKVTMGIRRDMFNKLHQMEMPYFDEHASGLLSARYFIDPSRVQRAIVMTFRVLLTKSITTVTLVAVMGYHSWKLALVALGILSLVVLPITLIRKRLIHLSNQEVESSSRLISLLNESFYGIKILLSFGALPYQAKRYEAAQQDNYHQFMKMAQAKGMMAPITHTITAVGIATIIWYGSFLVLSGEMTTGALLSFIVALVMLYRPIKGLGNSVADSQKALSSADRIFEVLDAPNVLVPQPGTIPLNQLSNSICFENVWFKYAPETDWVLKGVNLTLPKGHTVALVGGSGSGKTTLVELLMGFYTGYEGRITIDGHTIKDINFSDLCRNIAYVSQDTMLFDGTLYENVVLGNPNASPEEVERAIQLAYLTDWVSQLPDGLQTPIGERGVKLSGGQRQRLAIARAILKDAPILILDEATSALDNESEAVIQKALNQLMTNRTVLIIAHRLSTIQAAHRILVMEQGVIAEEGTHQSLLSQETSRYHQIYNAQFHEKALLSP